MKKKSEFSSKKVSEFKVRKRKKAIDLAKPRENNDFFEDQRIKSDLRIFYNSEAKKYAETRKKFWHEEKAILDEITPLFEQNKKVRVLEFWCWSGRFASLLTQHFPDKFDYVWIDLSDELLSYASAENPNLTFFQWDITKLVKNFEQESFDLIVWTSSFQHIPSAKERSFLVKNFYRLLDYDGMLLMTNWSLSKWFISKHWKVVLKWLFSAIAQFDLSKCRDLMVPWTDYKWKVYERFYHFFTLKELENLNRFSWLSQKMNVYIDQDANFTYNEKISRSSFLVSLKKPILD